ncbi:MAG: hypothetical protein H6709_24510 [Kofleriaceae bacterium]|nr:hypothetical protein [Myxococcales bacterium]MCB9575253.1 hypothetical protein [Kofleriaceae bacterium]
MTEPPTERRWRAFADVVAVALGTNVWVSMVVLPALFVGALRSTGVVLTLLLAPAVLLTGVWRRSELMLLGVFPTAVLVPIALRPEMAASHVYGPLRFVIVAVGLVGYLLGVSFFTTFHEPQRPVSERLLTSAREPRPPRWRRRERVYWTLAVLAAVVPAYLIWEVSFDDDIQGSIAAWYPGRIAPMTTLLMVGAVALSVAIYAWVFLGVMRPHRTGDRDLVTLLAVARADAQRGRPRPRFYLGVIFALAFMAAMVVLRHL